MAAPRLRPTALENGPLQRSNGSQQVGHVAIRVDDMERAKAFYLGLGMKLIWDAEDWAYLEPAMKGWLCWAPTTKPLAPTSPSTSIAATPCRRCMTNSKPMAWLSAACTTTATAQPRFICGTLKATGWKCSMNPRRDSQQPGVMEIQAETLALLEWERLGEQVAGFAGSCLGANLCRPLQLAPTLEEAQRRQAETAELLGLDGLTEGGLSFQGVSDHSTTVQLCSKGGCAGGEDLLQLADTLAAARRLRRQIDDDELRPVTTALLEGLRTLPELEQQLRFAIEEGGRVADRASPPLAGLRRQLQSQRQERQSRLQELMRRWANQLQDSVIAQRHGRRCWRLSRRCGSLQGQVHDSSASGNTLFIEPQAVVGLGNRIAELEAQELKEERRVLLQLSAAVAEEEESLLAMQDCLARLDLGLARARYGAWLGAVKPSLGGECWQLKELRHPLLVWQERQEGGTAVVPVSLQIEPTLRVVAITCPNTGGKTVTLKSLGLATLMARAGLFLPCSGIPQLPWCDAVLADIGDEQSLQQNLSTFSGHVRRIAQILEALSSLGAAPVPALVLLDEVGAGTDPSEGAALATALLRHLADQVQLSVATTHFGELKALKYDDSRFENASVEFDEVSLRPTYRLLWGIPGRSNALAVARRLGLSEAGARRC